MMPPSMSLHQLYEERPTLTLAIMGVASYENSCQQVALVKLFREMVSMLILEGHLNTLDVLQGLLVSVAWAQYQPRPNRHSAYLHLAMGVVTDMRLDCPTKMRSWQFFSKHSQQDSIRSSDELRALAGTYYLSASSSMVLLKRQSFPYTSIIYESCQLLSRASEYPSDRFLPSIVQLQQLMEQVDEIIRVIALTASIREINAHIRNAQQKLEMFRMSNIASLHECQPLIMQMHMIDLLISQLLMPGFPFSIDKHQVHITSEQKLTECFSASTTAAKSLLSGLLVLPPGFEASLSNMKWIMVHCALSIAARLDVMTADPRIDGTVRHMRRFLDFPLSLTQIIQRIESLSSDEIGKDAGDSHTFSDFLNRAKAIEAWYLQQTGRSSLVTMPSSATAEELEVPGLPPLKLTTVDGGGSSLHVGSNIQLAGSTPEGNAASPGIEATQPLTAISERVGKLSDFSVMDFFNLEDQEHGFGTFYGSYGY
ncbi:MAG: hypothetical protein M1820_007324 [Bogoriella megaspora]|nr:MAG: hypothetical protein M1820_007324 [Bogoriella megaspora]